MATQFREGQRLQGSDGNVYVVRGGVPTLEATAAPQPMTLGSPSPKAAYEAPLAAAQLDKIRADIANQNKPSLPQGYRWKGGVVGGEAEPIPGLPPNVGAVKLSAKERADAIAGFKSAQQLDDIIKDLEAKYAAGPGKTKGLKGLRDYLPYTANQDFDNAGNAARGIVGQALGFTGGQLNTATEAAMSVGPYLPQSGDRDQVILSKIARLKDLAAKARERAIAQLGGMPDANGNVHPVEDDLGLATGDQKFTPDEAGSRLATELARNGMSDDQINAALQAGGFAPLQPASIRNVREFLKQNPGFKGNVPGVGKFSETSALNKIASSPFGTFLGNVGVSGAAGLPVLLAGQEGKQAFDLANEESPKASLFGSAVGGTAATLGGGKLLAPFKLAKFAAANPRAAALLGDTLYGAAYGGATADEDNRGVGALAGAGGGILGNFIGRGGAKLAGGVTRGVVNPSVDYLRSRGVRLTGGQMLGGFTKRLEDTLAGYGFAGAPLRNRLTEGLEDLNRAGYQIGGEPIGHVEQEVGRAGLNGLDAAKGVAYDTALGSMNLNLDPPYFADRAVADATGAALPDVLRPTFDATMRKADSFVQPGGAIPGRSTQAIKRTIREEMRANKGKPGGQFLNDALGQADSAFMDMAARQAPDETALYRAADLTHGRAKVLGKAVDAASGKPGDPGIWSGAQLASALKGANVTRDAREALGPLAENAVRILPSQVPDSGTAGRLALGAIAAGSPLAGVGYVTDGADGAQTGGTVGLSTILTLAALNTKAGRTAAEHLLLDRPDVMRRLGAGITRRAGIFGGAGLGLGTNVAGVIAN